MTKGGARTRSGPAPDPGALRRERDAGEWTILPPGGRPGPIPDWPLIDPLGREEQLWNELWSRPQALMWDRYGQHFEVALYVRRLVEAELPNANVSLGTLVRQMADSLGLTTPGLRSNRWRIAAEEDVATPSTTPAGASSARSRMTVLNGGRDI